MARQSSGLRDARLWAARVLIGLVFFFNVQCAIVFLATPQAYVAGFEMSGAAGESMVRSLGLLFLMWNVPYGVALWHPRRHRVSLMEAVGMQAIGLVGESFLLWSLGPSHSTLQATATRFIAFDGGGLLALILALGLSKRMQAHDR